MPLSESFAKSYIPQTTEPLRTPFVVTAFGFSKEQDADFASKSVHAHDLIIDQCMSPYLAWALTLKYRQEDLPSLLNLDQKSCDYLVEHPEQSPPTRNVHVFCSQIGVHPAYLLPVIRDSNYSCHYPILRAVAHIYKDTRLSQHDRDIARICLEDEQMKFQAIKGMDLVAYSYLVSAMHSIRRLFNYTSNNPASDIELGLDRWEKERHEQIDKAMTAIEQEAQPGPYDEQLLRVGSLMYGADRAPRIIENTIHMVSYYEREEKDLNWKICEDGVWEKTSRTDKKMNEIIWTGNFRREFEWNAKEYGYEPELLLESFRRNIEIRVMCNLQRDKNKIVLDDLDRGLEKYQAWRQSEKANLWHIPQFANYILAVRALGKSFRDNAAAPEIIESKPRKRHSYDYIME